MSQPFKVMRGEEELILKKPFQDGRVYYTTDTKCIYFDTYLKGQKQEKLLMGGGNSGVFYAHKSFTDNADTSFSIDDIEGNDLPSPNDVIINYDTQNEIREGFYRVQTVDVLGKMVETSIFLPIGAGGGGGTGPGQGSNKSGYVSVSALGQSTAIKTTKQLGYKIKYGVEAYNNKNEQLTGEPIQITYIVNGVSITGPTLVHGKQEVFDVSQYLLTTQQNTVTVKAVANTGGIIASQYTLTWYIDCIDLRVSWNRQYSSANYETGNTFNISFNSTGGDCKYHILIDNGQEPTEGVNYYTGNTTSGAKSVTIPSMPYGAYVVSLYLTAEIGDTTIPSNTVKQVITFTNDEDGKYTSPILTVPFFDEIATQYDTLQIPFLIYQPKTNTVPLKFYVDGIEVMSDEYSTTSDKGPHYWPYTIGVSSGEFTLKIEASPTEFWEHKLTVTPLALPGLADPVDGQTFALRAKEFSGNQQLRDWHARGNSDIKLEFSDNFDWENGGIKFETDAKGHLSKYICVCKGTTMTITYPLFGANSVINNGKNFKFCFKATNCFNYDAKVLECMTYNNKTPVMGLSLTAQQGLLTGGGTTLKTQYSEGNYIELEAEVWPRVADTAIPGTQTSIPGDRFLMFWIDGVPSGVAPFDFSTVFQHGAGNQPYITIGSDECDVYVYTAKLNERKLSEDEHLNSFIYDAPNIKEIQDRYNRNDIIDELTGEISYSKLVEKNKGCHAYLYELPQGMTIGSDTEKNEQRPCHYTEYYEDGSKPYLTSYDPTLPKEQRNAVSVLVQGTSSKKYGVAAYNVRTDFAGDEGVRLFDANGQRLEGRKVSATSIPIDYTCTKVNVASCEGVNNALNAEWYNRFQPYHDGHRRKTRSDGNLYRDCMEFDFGVMFLADYNTASNFKDASGKPIVANYPLTNVFAYDINGNYDSAYMEAEEKPYRMYAVANMGNDKKNRAIFHDRNNQYTCCVEVLDNNSKPHEMVLTIPDGENWFKEDGRADEEPQYYEMRYSVEKTKVSNPSVTVEDQKEAFRRLVNWFASLDPSPYDAESHPNGYTGAQLLEPVTFTEPKVFTGFLPPNVSPEADKSYRNLPQNKNMINGVKGIEIDKFVNKEFTHDTREYRLAKLLYECEDYLVMDSIIYHYLFIQRHTMVDNVAKNTFWSTEDGLHWDLTKNYDNDTADGNNNSGYLTFSYGVEVLDRDGLNEIWNGNGSVWLNFIYHFPELQEAIYKQLSGVGAWRAEPYLDLFEEKQSLIPERCWIYDYFKKYIRPRRLGLDEDTYLNRLEGGKKTHQRRQYETYQEYYMDSKYCSGTAFQENGALDMRLNSGGYFEEIDKTQEPNFIEGKNYYRYVQEKNTENYVYVLLKAGTDYTVGDPIPEDETYYTLVDAEWNNSVTLPISYYIDLYPSALIGGQLWRGERTTALNRDDRSIPVGELLTSPTDATCYIYGAPMIQKLENLSAVYPSYMTSSAIPRINKLGVGSDDLTYFNHHLRSLGLNNATQLEEADLQRVGHDTFGNLNLNKATMLRTLKLTDANITGLTLAPGCIIDTLYLTDKLQSIYFDTLFNLNETAKDENSSNKFQYDDGLFASLQVLSIQDCAGINEFSYKAARNSVPLHQYRLNNIDWKVPEGDFESNAWIPDDGATYEDQVQKYKAFITVLNKLSNIDTVNNMHSSLALTGKIEVALPSQTTKKVEEFLVYAAYKSTFPNLNISFTNTNSNNFEQASTIRFYSDYNPNSRTGEVLYEVKTSKGYSLSWLTSQYGPIGIAMNHPVKKSDSDFIYTWGPYYKEEAGALDYDANRLAWYEVDERTGQYVIEEGKTEPTIYTHSEVMSISPNTNRTFAAFYKSDYNTFTYTFKKEGGKLGDEDTTEDFVIEGIRNNQEFTNQAPIYLYKEHPSSDMRYEFQGWISAADYQSSNVNTNPPVITEFFGTGKNQTYYAFYKEKRNKVDSSRLEYFTIDMNNNNHNIIKLKEKYRTLIKEPLTLPLTVDDTAQGEKLTMVSNFGCHEGAKEMYIPAIYFKNNGQNGGYTTIDSNCFQAQNDSSSTAIPYTIAYKEIILPTSITHIGEGAFRGCKVLETIGITDQNYNDYNGLRSLGKSAFQHCFELSLPAGFMNDRDVYSQSVCYMYGKNNSKIQLTSLDHAGTVVNGYAFRNCAGVNVVDFTKVTTFGGHSFEGAGNSSIVDIKLPDLTLDSITTSASAFDGYGNIQRVGITNYSSMNTDQETMVLRKLESMMGRQKAASLEIYEELTTEQQ